MTIGPDHTQLLHLTDLFKCFVDFRATAWFRSCCLSWKLRQLLFRTGYAPKSADHSSAEGSIPFSSASGNVGILMLEIH